MHGEDAPHHIFIDIGSKRVIYLLRDPWAAKPWIAFRSFMVEKGREGIVQEQDCLSYRFQVIISNSPLTRSGALPFSA